MSVTVDDDFDDIYEATDDRADKISAQDLKISSSSHSDIKGVGTVSLPGLGEWTSTSSTEVPRGDIVPFAASTPPTIAKDEPNDARVDSPSAQIANEVLLDASGATMAAVASSDSQTDPATTSAQKNSKQAHATEGAALDTVKLPIAVSTMKDQSTSVPTILEKHSSPGVDSSGLPLPMPTFATSSEDNMITYEQIAGANRGNPEAEFEIDSSFESSSDSSSDSSDSDDSEDDFKILSPEEQAKRLMAEDAPSDEEGGKGSKPGERLRTTNERPEQIIPKPDIEITDEMQMELLGVVEHIVDNTIVIRGKTPGEQQVLESGSLVCSSNREVLGVISETWGRVEQPFYCVLLETAAAIAEAGIAKDSIVFFVKQHSTHVFTQPLKGLKGSDASNLHDEEIGADEAEFSDDEAEAEFRRQQKLQKQARREGRELSPATLKARSAMPLGRGRGRGGGGASARGARSSRDHPYARTQNGEAMSTSIHMGLNYDDDTPKTSETPSDGLYRPLIRPRNFHELSMAHPPPPPPPPQAYQPRPSPRGRGWTNQRGKTHGHANAPSHQPHSQYPPSGQMQPHAHSQAQFSPTYPPLPQYVIPAPVHPQFPPPNGTTAPPGPPLPPTMWQQHPSHPHVYQHALPTQLQQQQQQQVYAQIQAQMQMQQSFVHAQHYPGAPHAPLFPPGSGPGPPIPGSIPTTVTEIAPVQNGSSHGAPVWAQTYLQQQHHQPPSPAPPQPQVSSPGHGLGQVYQQPPP